MDNESKWFAAVLIVLILTVFSGLFGSTWYQDRQIAKSADPIATACALGKEKACTALANRKP